MSNTKFINNSYILKLNNRIFWSLIFCPFFRISPNCLKNRGRFFKKLGPILKLGPKLKTLIILYLSFEMELIEIKCKLRPLNMHPKVFSLSWAALFGNYWQPNVWS